jgi:hypothetical protein
MNPLEHERYGKIRLFETYIRALASLVDYDSALLSWKKNRVSLSHRLAQHLEQGLFGTLGSHHRSSFLVDMCAPIVDDSRALVPDIVVHDRNSKEPNRLMAIVCREGYLTEEELVQLHALKTNGHCELTLAMAFLANKEYFLIYRADDTTIDYYHFLIHEKHCQLFKRRQISDVAIDAHQLKLGIKTRKRFAPHQ